jgi:hypothetical protein
MLAWEPMSADEYSPEEPLQPLATGLLYRLTAAFPSCAGALLAVYSIFLCRFGGFKIRPR